jgi:dihydrofolate reductase
MLKFILFAIAFQISLDLFIQGRQAIEWVISRIKEETQDIGRAARFEMDKHFNQKTTSL